MEGVRVLKLTPQGKFLEEYDSVTEAARQNDCHRSAVSSSADGRRNLGSGFKWVYRHKLTTQEYFDLVKNK